MDKNKKIGVDMILRLISGVSFCFLIGCGESGNDVLVIENNNTESPPQVHVVDDPAMAPIVLIPQEEVLSQSAMENQLSNQAQLFETNTDQFQINLASRQIFLPDVGWLEETEFWDLYMTQPGKIKVEIDYAALHSMGFEIPHISTEN